MHQKLVVRLIIYIPLIAMVIMSGRYVARQVDLTIYQANGLLVCELNQRLGREVRVKRTSVKPWGTAVLEGVEVASDKRLAQGLMLTIPRLIVHYDLRALIMGNKGAQSVSTVTLEGPTLNLIRRPDGSFNVLDLLPKHKGPSGPPFSGGVDMRGATVTFTDYLAGVGKAPAVNVIRNVDAVLDAGGRPVYAFSVSASGSPGRFTLARAVGTYDSGKRTIDVDLTGEGASASYWSHYFKLARSIDIQAGTAKVVLGVHYRKMAGKSRTSFAGAIDISEGVVNLSMFTQPVKQVEGKVAISGQRLLLSLSGIVGNTKATVTGGVTDFAKPMLSLLATSKSADFAGLMGSLKVPKAVQEIHPKGAGPLQVVIDGSTASPVIEAVGTIPSVSFRGYNPDQVSADAVYRDGRIEFRGLRFGLLDGRFAGKGSISLNGVSELAIQGRADGVKLSMLPLPSGVEGSGRGSASFEVSGPISDPKVSANVTVSQSAGGGHSIRGWGGGGRIQVRSVQSEPASGGRWACGFGVRAGIVDTEVDGPHRYLGGQRSAKVCTTFGDQSYTGHGLLESPDHRHSRPNPDSPPMRNSTTGVTSATLSTTPGYPLLGALRGCASRRPCSISTPPK